LLSFGSVCRLPAARYPLPPTAFRLSTPLRIRQSGKSKSFPAPFPLTALIGLTTRS
jgi:hypothetical protein